MSLSDFLVQSRWGTGSGRTFSIAAPRFARVLSDAANAEEGVQSAGHRDEGSCKVGFFAAGSFRGTFDPVA